MNEWLMDYSVTCFSSTVAECVHAVGKLCLQIQTSSLQDNHLVCLFVYVFVFGVSFSC